MNIIKNDELKVIVPISLELDWPTKERIKEEILQRYNEYNLKSFALAAPQIGWRSVQHPTKEYFASKAKLFAEIKEELKDYDIELGWWNCLTVKSGLGFEKIIKEDGEEHPFASCPLDPAFKECFSTEVALFASIAKPDFILLEDDFCISSAGVGCYCKRHLNEFARRMGKYYTREELLTIAKEKKEGAKEIVKAWQELKKDSMVSLAESIRKQVDILTPEIPIGTNQTGYDRLDGNSSEAVARALAGEKHTPFSRIQGTYYNDHSTKHVSTKLFFTLYLKQHIKGDFAFLHESDTYPHTRFFVPAAYMRSLMGIAYSYGYEGSIFQTNQLLDNGNEEFAYADMYKKEQKRFTEVSKTARQCDVKGVEICYDTFLNTYFVPNRDAFPKWTYLVSRYGLPFTTTEAPVAFWDNVQALFHDDQTVKKYLSKTLVLDGSAAKALCERGYSKYLGVTLGDDVTEGNRLTYDLGAREVIKDKFVEKGNGRDMHAAHMYARTKGVLYEMKLCDEKCEVVSELYTFQKEFVSIAMTRFENSLGGKIIVMGQTIAKNESQSLFNYRRQRLLQKLLCEWGGADLAFVREAPDVYVIQNEATDPVKSGFSGMLTLSNICEDDLYNANIHLPQKFKNKKMLMLDINGEWKPLPCKVTDDGITLDIPLENLTPLYILFK